jgi:hypothetical protein
MARLSMIIFRRSFFDDHLMISLIIAFPARS